VRKEIFSHVHNNIISYWGEMSSFFSNEETLFLFSTYIISQPDKDVKFFLNGGIKGV